jgi:hypothetical protein
MEWHMLEVEVGLHTFVVDDIVVVVVGVVDVDKGFLDVVVVEVVDTTSLDGYNQSSIPHQWTLAHLPLLVMLVMPCVRANRKNSKSLSRYRKNNGINDGLIWYHISLYRNI